MGRRLGILIGAILGLAAAPAAAEVEFTISPEPYYVGTPITLRIDVLNEPEHEPPSIPKIDGATVSEPRTERRQHSVNSNVTRSVSYTYQIVPHEAGSLTIPSIEVALAGGTRQTSSQTFEILKTDNEGLLYVEVHGDREKLYLGESIELALEIWIKPFINRKHNFGTSSDMQGCIDFRNSGWGPFASLLQELRRLPVKRGRRADPDGVEQDYYVYRLERAVWPEKAGRVELRDINIIVDYPLRVSRDRTFFFNEARVTQSRSISARAQVDPIVVQPIPTDDQPPWYNGAVGRCQFDAVAKPTEVHVGDPITLTMTIRGGGRLDLLQPPRIDRIESLSRNFKIPNEILAGEVSGEVKRFTQTIRARSDTVQEIPAIPFTYFDTEKEEFVTLYSKAIPLRVAASGRIAVSGVVESDTGPRVSTRLTRRAEGILGNYTNIDELLTEQAFAPAYGSVICVASPPLLLAMVTWARRRRTRLKYDTAYASRRTAGRTALRALRAAGATNDARGEAGIVLTALPQYIADRCGQPSSRLTRGEAAELLRSCSVAEEHVALVDGLLEECESLQYAGTTPDHRADLGERARGCVALLEKERF
ncbi:MAG: protein BatD [bacterium]|nr:protein BatD [bacterium]